jgi:hypothetical protein
MRNLVILFVHVIATLVRLLSPGGIRSMVAESVLVKEQLLILNRSRQRSPNLRTSDRLVAGLCALLIRSARLIGSAIAMKPPQKRSGAWAICNPAPTMGGCRIGMSTRSPYRLAGRCSCAAASLLFLLLGAARALPAVTQTGTLDLASFTPPAGWKVTQDQTAIVYTVTDEAARTYCMLGVYASAPGSGNATRDFAAEWQSIVRHNFTAGSAPTPAAGQIASGLTYVEGGADVKQQGTSSYAHLMVFSVGTRTFSVLIVATDRAALRLRRATIQDFLDSLRAPSPPESAPSRAITSIEPPTARQTSIQDTRLTFDVPAGWNRTEISGLVTLVRVEDLGFGMKNEFRIISLPPERSAGKPMESFQGLWNKHVGGVFVTSMHPLPIRARLRTGAALLYDGGTMRLRQNNAEATGFLYVVVDGDLIAPFLAVFTGWDQALDRALRPFFDSVRVPGGTGQPKPLFTRQELVGAWRSSSTTLANWVDTAGNYLGDASVATGDTLTLRTDGTYQSQFAAIGGGRTMRQNDTGTFDIEDDFLVLRPSTPGQGITRYRITGVGRSADGRGSFLLLGITRDDFPILSGGSLMPRAGDLYVGVRH